MKRFFLSKAKLIGSLGCLALLLATTANLQAQDKQSIQRMSETSLRNLEVESILKKRISVSFDEDPLADVMEVLSEEHGFNLVLSMSARDNGISEDELITVKLKNVPIYRALEAALESLDGTYAIADGVVMIIPIDNALDNKFMRTRTFDCSALIDKMNTPQQTFVAPSNGGGGFGGGGGGAAKGGGVFSVSGAPVTIGRQLGGGPLKSGPANTQPAQVASEPSPDEIKSRKCEKLVSVVNESVDGNAVISFIGEIMVVNADENSLRRIENLLIDVHSQMKIAMPNQPARDLQSVKQSPKSSLNLGVKTSKKQPTSKQTNDPFGNSDDEFSEDSDNPFGN